MTDQEIAFTLLAKIFSEKKPLPLGAYHKLLLNDFLKACLRHENELDNFVIQNEYVHVIFFNTRNLSTFNKNEFENFFNRVTQCLMRLQNNNTSDLLDAEKLSWREVAIIWNLANLKGYFHHLFSLRVIDDDLQKFYDKIKSCHKLMTSLGLNPDWIYSRKRHELLSHNSFTFIEEDFNRISTSGIIKRDILNNQQRLSP